MTETAYGIPVPRGVRKDWEAMALRESGVLWLRNRSIPEQWGDFAKCVGWFDRFGRLRLIVAHYSNGRSATVRIDANGMSKTTFGNVPLTEHSEQSIKEVEEKGDD